jgi:hypothetical protein
MTAEWLRKITNKFHFFGVRLDRMNLYLIFLFQTLLNSSRDAVTIKLHNMNKLPEVIQFSNVTTKLKLQAQINHAKKHEGVHSITFYYQMTLPVKIHMESPDETFDDLFNRFEDTILGKTYGGVILEKYKVEEGVKCYLIHDGRHYKIGKSKDPEKRLKEIKTANHKAKLVCYSELMPEKFFHEVYAHRRTGGEWFNLIDREVEVIIKMMRTKNKVKAEALMRMCARQLRRNEPTRNEIRVVNEIKERRQVLKDYDNAKFNFGKYSGIFVKDMQSVDQRKYLFWAYHNLGNMDAKIKKAIKMQLGL